MVQTYKALVYFMGGRWVYILGSIQDPASSKATKPQLKWVKLCS